MRMVVVLLLLCSCVSKPRDVLYNPHISNFVRDIDPSPDFKTPLEKNLEIPRKNKKPDYADIFYIQQACNAPKYVHNQNVSNLKDFYEKGGDCKDSAICKYNKLRAIGFTPAQLNVWSGFYIFGNQRISHLVLVVKFEDKQYVLEIGDPQIIEAKDYFYKKFLPTYRFNEVGADVN